MRPAPLSIESDDVQRAMAILGGHPDAHGPALIGEVTAVHPGVVEVQSRIGPGRIVDLLSGEQMPRIC